MPAAIIPSKIGLSATDREELEKLYGSAGYSILKRILTCHCIMEQVSLADALMYQDVETARVKANRHESTAIKLNWMLDKLDEVEGKPDEWFTLTLEHRR